MTGQKGPHIGGGYVEQDKPESCCFDGWPIGRAGRFA